MRVFYADTGLSQDLGHHANSCRLMTAEWRARGHDVTILASHLVTAALQEELGARPHFRTHTYWYSDGDPFCGWLNGFYYSSSTTKEDLEFLGPFTQNDLLYMNSIQPAQMLALANFLRAAPAAQRPRVVAELGTGPGLEFEWRDGMLHFNPKDPRHDAKGVLYRFTSINLAGLAGEDPILVTFHPTCSAVYQHLLQRQVHTVPVPHHAVSPIVSRIGHHPLTVGVLGHQRGDKGYQMMPEVALLLLAADPDVRVLLHNGAPDFMKDVQGILRALAAEHPRIIIDERTADLAIWDELLRACDIVLCPYDPPSYIAAYSAVVGEALALGLPVVVPDTSTLARTFHDYGAPGATFFHFNPQAIAAATLTVMADFNTYAARAVEAAVRWKATMGAANTVAAIESLLGRAESAIEPEAANEVPIEPERKVA